MSTIPNPYPPKDSWNKVTDFAFVDDLVVNVALRDQGGAADRMDEQDPLFGHLARVARADLVGCPPDSSTSASSAHNQAGVRTEKGRPRMTTRAMKRLVATLAIASILAIAPAFADNEEASKKDTIALIVSKIGYYPVTDQIVNFQDEDIMRVINPIYYPGPLTIVHQVEIADLVSQVEIVPIPQLRAGILRFRCQIGDCVTEKWLTDGTLQSEIRKHYLSILVPMRNDLAKKMKKVFEHLIRLSG